MEPRLLTCAAFTTAPACLLLLPAQPLRFHPEPRIKWEAGRGALPGGKKWHPPWRWHRGRSQLQQRNIGRWLEAVLEGQG